MPATGLPLLTSSITDVLDAAAVGYQVVLTKADKPKPNELERALSATRLAIARRPAAHPHIHVTSAEQGAGLAELRAEIAMLGAP